MADRRSDGEWWRGRATGYVALLIAWFAVAASCSSSGGGATRGGETGGAPTARFVLTPEELSSSLIAEFGFEAESAARFRGRVDDGELVEVRSPHVIRFDAPADGEHRFELIAEDSEGRAQAEPTVHVWTIDTTPPRAPSETRIDADGSSTIDVEWSEALDNGSGISHYEIHYDTDGPGAPYEGDSANEGASPIESEERAARLTGLDGCRSHFVSIVAVDRAGNRSLPGPEATTRTRCGGNGTFEPPVQIGVGKSPGAVAVGDFDGDGLDDVAVSNSGSDSVSILLGSRVAASGDAPLMYRDQIQVRRPGAMLVHDLDKNGIADLAVASWPKRIALAFGKGTDGRGSGTFGPPIEQAVPMEPRGLSGGEFGQDGLPDIAVVGSAFGPFPAFAVLLGEGTSGRPQGSLVVDALGLRWLNYSSVASRDLNGDGFSDHVLVRELQSTGLVEVYSSANGPANTRLAYELPAGLSDLVLEDFDGDSILDAVVTNAARKSFHVLRGLGVHGRGTARFTALSEQTIGARPTAVVAADLNDDRILDLGFACSDPDSVVLMFGVGENGRGTATFAAPVLMETSSAPSALEIGDFNGDGIEDIITAHESEDAIRVFLGRGSKALWNGTFVEGPSVAAPWGASGSVAGDLSGDGIRDLVVRSETELNLFRGTAPDGRPDGSFEPAGTHTLSQVRTSLQIAADFNGDSITDIALYDRETGRLSVVPVAGPGFGAPVDSRIGAGFTGAATGDFNADSHVDLALLRSDGELSIELGSGDGRFELGATYRTESAGPALATADFDADGIPDLAVAGSTSRETTRLMVLLGNARPPYRASGTFRLGSVRELPLSGVIRVVAADFDSDGIPDLALASSSYTQIVVLRGAGTNGRGSGAFELPTAHPAGGLPSRELIARDIDRDGATDLLVVLADTGELAVLRRHPDRRGEFLPPVRHSTGASLGDVPPLGLDLADYDGDGVVDVSFLDLAGPPRLRVWLGGRR